MKIFASLLLIAACTTDVSERSSDPQTQARVAMVEKQIAARGVEDRRVLDAMRKVPRHRFVPQPYTAMAYSDSPLPIGLDQTISQPYIVGYMSEQLRLQPHHRVLEIGTGSGYQAAILGELAREVYTIEIVEPLAQRAEKTLQELGYKNVFVRAGDGYRGWPEKAPFDAIIVTAAPDHIPPALVEQLAVGGRMVIPVGEEMTILTKTARGVIERKTIPVRFVPMTGEAQKQ